MVALHSVKTGAVAALLDSIEVKCPNCRGEEYVVLAGAYREGGPFEERGTCPCCDGIGVQPLLHVLGCDQCKQQGFGALEVGEAILEELAEEEDRLRAAAERDAKVSNPYALVAA
jgi:Zn finger protein HypA/HybF involved in hydrogenase expression